MERSESSGFFQSALFPYTSTCSTSTKTQGRISKLTIYKTTLTTRRLTDRELLSQNAIVLFDMLHLSALVLVYFGVILKTFHVKKISVADESKYTILLYVRIHSVWERQMSEHPPTSTLFFYSSCALPIY